MAETVAAVFGGLYLLVGVVGFVLNPGGGSLLGVFAVNWFHHTFHIVVGGLGLLAAWRGPTSAGCGGRPTHRRAPASKTDNGIGGVMSPVTRGQRIYLGAVAGLALWVGVWCFCVPGRSAAAIPWTVAPLCAAFLGAMY